MTVFNDWEGRETVIQENWNLKEIGKSSQLEYSIPEYFTLKSVFINKLFKNRTVVHIPPATSIHFGKFKNTGV